MAIHKGIHKRRIRTRQARDTERQYFARQIVLSNVLNTGALDLKLEVWTDAVWRDAIAVKTMFKNARGEDVILQRSNVHIPVPRAGDSEHVLTEIKKACVTDWSNMIARSIWDDALTANQLHTLFKRVGECIHAPSIYHR